MYNEKFDLKYVCSLLNIGTYGLLVEQESGEESGRDRWADR